MTDTERDSLFGYVFSICDILKKESNALLEILDYPEDSENVSRKVAAYEEEADSVFHDIVMVYQNSNLARDPEAVAFLEFSRSVEAITDELDQLAMNFYRYNILELRDDIYSSFMNITRANNTLINLVFSLKKRDKIHPPIKDIVELDSFKVESERMYNDNIRKLFTQETDSIEIIKWKSMYDSIRKLFEAYESVADLSARVILYNS